MGTHHPQSMFVVDGHCGSRWLWCAERKRYSTTRLCGLCSAGDGDRSETSDTPLSPPEGFRAWVTAITTLCWLLLSLCGRFVAHVAVRAAMGVIKTQAVIGLGVAHFCLSRRLKLRVQVPHCNPPLDSSYASPPVCLRQPGGRIPQVRYYLGAAATAGAGLRASDCVRRQIHIPH